MLAFIWGVPQFKAFADSLWAFKFVTPNLDKMVLKSPPVVPKVIVESVVFNFNALSMASTGVLILAIAGSLLMGYSLPRMLKKHWNTIKLTHYSLLTICVMFGIDYLMRYSGLDAVLGLVFAHMGVLYPLSGTMLG